MEALARLARGARLFVQNAAQYVLVARIAWDFIDEQIGAGPLEAGETAGLAVRMQIGRVCLSLREKAQDAQAAFAGQPRSLSG